MTTYNDRHYDYDDGPDETGRFGRLVRLSGMAVSVAIVAGLVFWSYRLGVKDAGQVPVIQAIEGTVRERPIDPGGEVVAHQGLEVNAVLGADEEGTEVSSDITLAPDAPSLADVPVVDEDVVAAANAAEDEQVLAALEVTSDNLPTYAVTEPTRRPKLLHIPPQREMNQTTEEARPVEGSERAAEETTAAPEMEAVDPNQTALVTPQADDAGERLPSGTALIQLGAFESEDVTRNEWIRLQDANFDILGDKKLFIEKREIGGRMFYRLRVTGFASSGDTQAACSALLARGFQCISAVSQ